MRSLTTRVALAGSLVAVTLVGAVGITAFVALRGQIRDSLQRSAVHMAELHGSRSAALVTGIMADLASNAENPLIANALTDTVGRDAYVVPFLRGIQEVNGVPVSVAMTDHLGRTLAAGPRGPARGAEVEAARRAIAGNGMVTVLADGGEIVEVATPIIYRSTGTPEGALVYRFVVANLRAQDFRAFAKGITIELTDRVPPARPVDWGIGRSVHAVRGGLAVVVSVQADERALDGPQRRLLVVFAAVGLLCLGVVVAGSRIIARLVTRRLVRLEMDAARVVATGAFGERFPTQGGDEVARLAMSFNKVLDRLEDEAARRLEDSESRYRLLAEHASDVIARVTADGRVRYVSPAIAALVGIDPVAVVGGRLQTFIHPADRDRVGARLASPGEGGAISFRMTRMAGGHVWVEASTHGLGGEDGDVVAIIRDVTRRKAAEDALAAKTVDLERSNAELEQFAYVASHDLREPLRMVANYLQLIDRKLGDGKDEDLTDFLGFAIDGAKRMDRLILDLLEFSRVGRNRPDFEPVDLAEVLDAAAQPFRDKIAAAGGRLDLPEAAPAVDGDRQELARLFQNLIGNAVKYVPPDRAPEVVVSVAAEPEGVVVSVADNGIGIAEDHRERVFQIFQRLHSRDKYEGTGVGLAICRKIVDLHGGRIWIEANGDAGSVFRVALPAAEA